MPELHFKLVTLNFCKAPTPLCGNVPPIPAAFHSTQNLELIYLLNFKCQRSSNPSVKGMFPPGRVSPVNPWIIPELAPSSWWWWMAVSPRLWNHWAGALENGTGLIQAEPAFYTFWASLCPKQPKKSKKATKEPKNNNQTKPNYTQEKKNESLTCAAFASHDHKIIPVGKDLQNQVQQCQVPH